MYNQGTITDLGTLGGIWANAIAINGSGLIVGNSWLADWQTTRSTHAFLFKAGKLIDIGNFWAMDMNDSGQVVGYSNDPLPVPITYTNGVITKLSFGFFAVPTSINNSCQILCDGVQVGEEIRCLIINKDGSMTDIGSLGGLYTVATKINNLGQAIGRSSIAGSDFMQDAFVSSGGVMYDLNNVLSAGINTVLIDANDINQNGQIIAVGENLHSYLLTPVLP